jgi:DNA-binding MarR family transcriptional regulator
MKESDIDKTAMELAELLPLLQKKLIKPFEQLSKSKLSPMKFYVLFILEDKGNLSMTELSNELSISKQQMTPVVDKLIESGFIVRRHNEIDRRIITISLTSSGKKFIEELKMGIFDMLKNKLYGLNADDLNYLYKAFNEIRMIVNKLP